MDQPNRPNGTTRPATPVSLDDLRRRDEQANRERPAEPKPVGEPLQKALENIQKRPQTPEDTTKANLPLVGKLESDLGKRYSRRRATLDTFEVRCPGQQKVIDRLRPLVANLGTIEGGLIFIGSVGTGKDHLMAAMLYQAAWKHGISCRWVNGQEVFGNFRDRIDSGKADEDYFRQLTTPHILAISDPLPPVGNPGNWDLSNLYRLIDRRYRQMLATWVSINATDEAEADQRLSGPVWDRFQDGAEIFRCFWPSHREQLHAT